MLSIVFGIVGLAALFLFFGWIANMTGKVVDPIIDRSDRWVSRRFAKRPDERP